LGGGKTPHDGIEEDDGEADAVRHGFDDIPHLSSCPTEFSAVLHDGPGMGVLAALVVGLLRAALSG